MQSMELIMLPTNSSTSSCAGDAILVHSVGRMKAVVQNTSLCVVMNCFSIFQKRGISFGKRSPFKKDLQ